MEKEAVQNPEMAFFREHTVAPKKQLQLLPEDLIEEILSRLPVKSLVCFRSVCKRWNTLISSSRWFASMHLKRSLSNPTMHSIISICEYSDDERRPLLYLNPIDLAPLASSHDLDAYHPAVNPIDRYRPLRVFVGSINGLVCLRSIPGYETEWLGIWNPSTKTVRELMIPATKPDFYAVAFGWDPVANDHKVMRLCRSVSGGSGGWIEVWSVQGSSWRSFQIGELGDVFPNCTQNLIMGDGHTYCLISQLIRFGDTFRYRDLVACFDVVKEEIMFISLPVDTTNCKGDNADKVTLVNWKGDLALSTFIGKPGCTKPPSFQIWKADIDGDQCWTKSFIIDLSDLPCCFVCNPGTSISPTQMLFFFIGKLILYDLETKEYQNVKMTELIRFQACHHVQSLF